MPTADRLARDPRVDLVQLFGPERSVAYTGYHVSTADVPVSELSLGLDPTEVRERRRKQARLWGSVVGGALLAGGATAFGLAWSDRTQIENEPTVWLWP